VPVVASEDRCYVSPTPPVRAHIPARPCLTRAGAQPTFSTPVDQPVDNRGLHGMNVAGAENLWSRVSAAVRQQLSESTWEVWFQGIRAIDLRDDRLVVSVANPMARDRIQAMYRGVLDDACGALTGTGTTIEIVLDQIEVLEAPDDALTIDLTT